MQVDVIFSEKLKDFVVEQTQRFKAANNCKVQLTSLLGGPAIGIDFDKFVRGDLEFSMVAFRAHITERLSQLGCEAKTIKETITDLEGQLEIGV